MIRFLSGSAVLEPRMFRTASAASSSLLISLMLDPTCTANVISVITSAGFQENMLILSHSFSQKNLSLPCLRKTFTCTENYDAHSGSVNLVPLLEGNFFFFTLPLPYLLLHATADHMVFWIHMTSCFTEQLLPSN